MYCREAGDLPVLHRPNVGVARLGGLAGDAVDAFEFAERHHGFAFGDELCGHEREAGPLCRQGLQQALGDGAGTAAFDLVMPHGDPFDIRGHQIQGAGGIAAVKACRRSHGRCPSGWRSWVSLLRRSSAFSGLEGQGSRAPRVTPGGGRSQRKCLARKSRMAAPISRAWVSRAKCPLSTKRTSASGTSRLKTSAPRGMKNGSFLPHTARTGG